jgi:transposase
MPTDLVTMNPKELFRNACMQRIAERRQTQADAAEELGISLRHVERLYAAYKRAGAAGLISKRRGRPSNRRLPEAFQNAVVESVRADFADFGPTLAREKPAERNAAVPSVETFGCDAPLRSVHRAARV